MSLVTITIDGENYKVESGELLIDTLIKYEIDIPYFCYHEALGVDGNCRMCMVEIVGQKRPQIACDTFVKDGMEVNTRGEKIDGVRKDILELELINHPVDCPICDQAGECKLQDFYMDYGLYDSNIKVNDKVKHKKNIDLGSNVILDQERCVLCARCTRFTSNITKTGELGIINRADHACVSTMPGTKLNNPYAMNIVDLCPVGALTSKDFRFAQRVWFLTSTNSICHGCDTGCNIYIDHNKEKYKDDKIHRFRPRINKKINGHFICDYGRLSYKQLQENRQISVLRVNEEISYKEAIEGVDFKIKESKNIVILLDANLYNEDMGSIYAFAKDIGAKLVTPIEIYYDKEFGDDWLRSPWKCANKRALKEYDISETLDDDLPIDLLINFNHPQLDKYDAKFKVSFQTHQYMKADIVFPIPTYSEYSGTITNKDGIKQHCEQAVFRNEPIPRIASWIEKIKGVIS